ncbi:olfactory receptor 51I2-like isoform X2 [Convolutriloba macropyga]|uniref:olfactory receptor 51I2-like isoform X2 n=1 Tax=Convolutriloba macropyga TaxID=536237 RepID=UPI003F51C03F
MNFSHSEELSDFKLDIGIAALFGKYELEFPPNPDGVAVVLFETCWYIFLSFSIFWSSSFVIFVVIRTPQLHYPPGYLMVCMSLCDVFMALLIGSAVVPAFDHDFRYPTYVCHGQALLLAFFQNVNAMCLMVSALDQFVSIYWPLKYHQLVTTEKLIGTFVTIGFLGTLIPVYWAIVDNSWFDDYLYICFLVSNDVTLTNFQMLLMFVTPGVVVLICYLLILASVWKERALAVREQKQGRRSSAAAQGIQIVAQLNACKMLFLVTVIFFLSFIPYMAVDRYIVVFDDIPPVWVFKLSGWFIFIQSLLNFFLFYKMNVGFKRGAHKYFEEVPLLSRLVENRENIPLDVNGPNTGYRASFMTNSPRPSNYQIPATLDDDKMNTGNRELGPTTSFGNSLTLELAKITPPGSTPTANSNV